MVTIKRTLAVVAALGFALTAVAGPTVSRIDGSRSLQLTETAVLSGVKVPPGSYTLRWAREAGSESVRIEIVHGKKVVAAGQGHWTESRQPSPYESLLYVTRGGGNELTGICFRQSAELIRIGADTTQAAAPKASDTIQN
jgi:hypothetical protein